MKQTLLLAAVVGSVWTLGGCELLGLLGGAAGACPGAEDSMGTMTADVDGEPYEACIVVGSHDSGTFTVTGQYFEGGINPVQLQVVVNQDAAVGTFNLGDTQGQGRYTYGVDETYVTALDTATGTVEITAIDDTAATGTFSFDAVAGSDGDATVSVTNGAFDVTF
jgi:hypothetical protein